MGGKMALKGRGCRNELAVATQADPSVDELMVKNGAHGPYNRRAREHALQRLHLGSVELRAVAAVGGGRRRRRSRSTATSAKAERIHPPQVSTIDNG